MTLAACSGRGDWDQADELDTDFVIPRTESFAPNLSAYGLYTETMGELEPAEGVFLYEVTSELFTDYAKKQRLIKLPNGASATVLGDYTADYPDGTVVAKTFSYFSDFRDPSLGRRIIETRLLVKTAGVWNVATYLWNAEQTDATLLLDGTTTTVTWIAEDGASRSTEYEVPDEVACVTCHQSSGEVASIGLTPKHLNRPVMRDGQELNQLAHLQAQGVYAEMDPASVSAIVDYTDTSKSLEQRARAYLDANCSHCHSPNRWERASRQGLDLRYETSLADSGILDRRDRDERLDTLLEDGEMPLVGTALLHEEGVALVLEYLESL